MPAKGGSLVTADHSLHLASAPNLRDIGGYRTGDGKWVKVGLLYRSDGLDALTDADLATVQALGIKLVCDLRTDGERSSKPDKEIPGSTNEQFNIIGEDELTAKITSAITSGDKAAQQELLGDGKAERLLVDGGRSIVSGASPLARVHGVLRTHRGPGEPADGHALQRGQGPHRVGQRRESSPPSVSRRRRSCRTTSRATST